MSEVRFDTSASVGVPMVSELAPPAPREPAETRTSARFVIDRGPDAGVEITIDAASMTIGRDRSCDIMLDDPTVAGQHAQLRYQNGRFVLLDNASLNGVYLNRGLVDRAELVDGDQIWIGKARFVFRDTA